MFPYCCVPAAVIAVAVTPSAQMSSTGAMFIAAGTMLSCRTPRMISTSSTSLQQQRQQARHAQTLEQVPA
jgi:hypothetical protein